MVADLRALLQACDSELTSSSFQNSKFVVKSFMLVIPNPAFAREESALLPAPPQSRFLVAALLGMTSLKGSLNNLNVHRDSQKSAFLCEICGLCEICD
jgi:hypothetical protein